MASNGKAYLHSDPSFVLSSILLLTMVGIFVERRTTIGKALSANIVTMALALLIANLGFIPFASPVYTIVNKSLVPLAVPLFLFDSDLRRIIRDTGPLLVAFMVGAFSTIVGTLVAFPLFPMKALGIDQGLLAARAGSLSVGQQQRVAAARALIGFPPLIIADEPTSALDAASQETFLSLLFDHARTHNSAVMMVSHDARLAPMFDRVLHMDDIAQTLPPPLQKTRPATKPKHNA